MRPRTESRSAPMRRAVRGFALAAVLGGMVVFALLPRVGWAAPVHGLHPQAGTGSSMAPRAPTEVPVSPELKEVLTRLLCQCGCNLDAYQCQQTMTCDVSTAMWDQAAELVDRGGETPERALEILALDYGERVLAAPTKRGFNLTAWIMPFVVLALGAGIVAFTLRGWRPRPTATVGDDARRIDQRYLDQLERELQEDG